MSKLKRTYYKIRIFIRHFLSQKQIEIEQKKYASMCITIAKKLITNKDSVLVFTPISQKYYIHNKELSIFMVIDNMVLSVTNHSYSYEIKLTNKSEKILVKKFERELESRAENMDLEILSQIKESLILAYTKIESM